MFKIYNIKNVYLRRLALIAVVPVALVVIVGIVGRAFGRTVIGVAGEFRILWREGEH